MYCIKRKARDSYI